MKNMILGMLCCAIAICTIISCLSIYSVSSRKNEMENCVSQVLSQNLQDYYVRWKKLIIEREVITGWTNTEVPEGEEDAEPPAPEPIIGIETEIVMIPLRQYGDGTVASFVRQDIAAQLRSDSRTDIQVLACNMESGIISVEVTQFFYMPTGTEKRLKCRKTVVVDEGVEKNIVETETIRYPLGGGVY